MVEPTFMIKAETEKPGYGRFSIEPLEQGYGQTLGNSLRRVLLTSLPGAAITSIKIEGVKHQFSTIPGMKEDVVEFILNLKKVRLIVEGNDEVSLTLSKKGPGEIVAGDIEVPAGVTIVNPELVLATLADKKAEVDMQLAVTKGYGYVSVDDKREGEIGTIPVDALFSPITRVNYKVEATRVGRMTNLDRLVMEIWTDATVAPLEALKLSSRILVSYFQQIFDPKTAGVQEAPATPAALSDEVLKMRIEELDIPTRIVNALSKANLETIGQLLAAPRSDLLKVKNLGSKSLGIVEEKLKEKGITLQS